MWKRQHAVSAVAAAPAASAAAGDRYTAETPPAAATEAFAEQPKGSQRLQQEQEQQVLIKGTAAKAVLFRVAVVACKPASAAAIFSHSRFF